LQEQITTLSKQVAGAGAAAAANRKIAKPQIFDRTSSKVSEFIMVCKLYGKAKMRGVLVEEQIQWVLLYVQRGTADV